MKNRNLIYLPLIIAIGISFVLGACSGKNINMMDKERLLKERVQEHSNIMKEGKLGKLYNLICPQTRNKMKESWKNYLLSLGDNQIVEDFKSLYKIESINIEDDIGVVISYRKGGLDDTPIKIYQYWGFTDNNWYIMEAERTEPASQDLIDEYKNNIQDDKNNKIRN